MSHQVTVISYVILTLANSATLLIGWEIDVTKFSATLWLISLTFCSYSSYEMEPSDSSPGYQHFEIACWGTKVTVVNQVTIKGGGKNEENRWNEIEVSWTEESKIFAWYNAVWDDVSGDWNVYVAQTREGVPRPGMTSGQRPHDVMGGVCETHILLPIPSPPLQYH